MKQPTVRAGLPSRRDNLRPRSLADDPPAAVIAARFAGISYEGSSKHKRTPHLYDLEPFRGERGDATLCDKHAGWRPASSQRIPALLDRAKRAALLGTLIWTVDDNGWVYELQVTNEAQNQHHGYPLLPSDPFAPDVVSKFTAWAALHGTPADRQAATAAKLRYDVTP